MDEEMLIVEIQNHQIIYDPSHPFYKDNQKKDMVWNTISGVIGVDAHLCKAKWRSLRDTFVKHRKKGLASGSAAGSQKEWKYSTIMSFLLPYIHPRSSKSNLTSVLPEEDRSLTPQSPCGSEKQAPSSASVPYETQSECPAPLTSGPNTSCERDRPHRSRSPRERGSRPETRRSHRPQTSDVEERLLSILQGPPAKPESDLDECYHFALSLVPQLHKLDQARRHQAKMGILTLLHNIESSMASTQQNQSSSHTQPTPTFHVPALPLPRPGVFRPITHPPPPVNPLGPFMQVLTSDDESQRGVNSTTYTGL